MATLTLDVPDNVAQTVAALPDANRAAYLARINAFAVATLPDAGFISDGDPNEPVDRAFAAELIAAEEEAKRVGTIPFEDILRQADADSGPGFVERLRVHLVAEGVNPAQIIGAVPGASV